MLLNKNFLYTHRVCLFTQSCPTLSGPVDCGPPGSSGHGDSPGKNTGVGSLSLLQGIFPTWGSNPGLQHRRFTSWATGKPRNTGVGGLSLLQWIFTTQESNSGLLHCHWILYQLSYQGKPIHNAIISWAYSISQALYLVFLKRKLVEEWGARKEGKNKKEKGSESFFPLKEHSIFVRKQFIQQVVT